MVEIARESFSKVAYAYSSVPTYPSGQIGYLLATNDDSVVFEEPKTKFSETQCEALKLKYYDTQVHAAAFQLPRFIKKALKL